MFVYSVRYCRQNIARKGSFTKLMNLSMMQCSNCACIIFLLETHSWACVLKLLLLYLFNSISYSLWSNQKTFTIFSPFIGPQHDAVVVALCFLGITSLAAILNTNQSIPFRSPLLLLYRSITTDWYKNCSRYGSAIGLSGLPPRVPTPLLTKNNYYRKMDHNLRIRYFADLSFL